jgi:FlaA1/EpsC-like NDP-sugar epimerase
MFGISNIKIESRNTKRLLMLLGDIVLVPFALWIAFSLRLGVFYVPEAEMPYLFLLASIISVPIFIRFGLYNAIIRYIGFQALWAVVQAVSLYALVWGVVAFLSNLEGVLPRSVIIINWFVALLFIGGSRMVARWWLSGVNPFKRLKLTDGQVRKQVAIYGAGAAGVQLASALSFSSEYRPVAFIDDDPLLINHRVNGYRVYPFINLGYLIEKYNVTEILLALPSAPRSKCNKIVSMLEPYPVHVRTLPGIAELVQGKIRINDIREVEIEDLLGRDSVKPDTELLHLNIKQKTVLVTGAGGSIGAELCRQIMLLEPQNLILFEHSEFALYSIEKELQKIFCTNENIAKATDVKIIPVLGTVCNQNRLQRVCKAYAVQTIYHAAAYKHVPMVEKNPAEAIRNNVFGTLKTALAAINTGVETFVLISTDKAVRPTNTMGASKRFAELILQGLASKNNSATRFCMVRFGNVLGSSGSVVPLFREQIKAGGPVTVTDPKVIRYFMTIPEAAQLVIQAGAMGKGGDVFVLDMGKPVNILELAKTLISLSGLEIKDKEHLNGDIEIHFTGLRPGEKLYEELLIGNNVTSTSHPLIMRAEEEVLAWDVIQKVLDDFEEALDSCDQDKIRALLLEVIRGYKPQCGIEDVIYQQQALLKRSVVVDICSKKVS